MGALRNDADAWQHRVENLEHELAKAKYEIEKKNEEIAELHDKENARVNFYLEFGDEQEKDLKARNQQLHQELILLQSRTPNEIVHAARSLARMPDVAFQFQSMQREVRRSRILIVLLFATWCRIRGLPL